MEASFIKESRASHPFVMIPFAKHQSAFPWRLYADGSRGPLNLRILFWNEFAQEPLGLAQSDVMLPLERRGLKNTEAIPRGGWALGNIILHELECLAPPTCRLGLLNEIKFQHLDCISPCKRSFLPLQGKVLGHLHIQSKLRKPLKSHIILQGSFTNLKD